MTHYQAPGRQGLYDPQNEHDSCGVGFVVDIKNRKSHDIVEMGIKILMNLEHRGACGCEKETGDGAGLLVQMPHKFLQQQCDRAGFTLPPLGLYGAGCVFLPTDPEDRRRCQSRLQHIVEEEGQSVLGWPIVPVDNTSLGPTARAAQPFIRQIFIGASCGHGRGVPNGPLAFERETLYHSPPYREHDPRVGDRAAEHVLHSEPVVEDAHLQGHAQFGPSESLLSGDSRSVDGDGFGPRPFALQHEHVSQLGAGASHRYIAHNGEINTLRGNINWMTARERLFASELFGDDIKKVLPIIDQTGSDSGMFDNVLELLVLSGARCRMRS